MPTAWLPCPGNTNATVIGRTKLNPSRVRLDTSAALAVKLGAGAKHPARLFVYSPAIAPAVPQGTCAKPASGGRAHAGDPAASACRLWACPLYAFAYNSRHHPLRLEAERDAGSHGCGRQGNRPAPSVSAL